MAEFTGIAYEPHPVTPERKAELRAQGLRIIDIQFKPAEPEPEAPFAEPAEPAAPAAPVVTKSPRKPKP